MTIRRERKRAAAKRKKKPTTRTARAQKKLNDAVKRLDPDQARVARGNARTAVLDAARQLREAMDAEYPTIRKAAKRRAQLTPRLRRTRLLKAGKVQLDKADTRCRALCKKLSIPISTHATGSFDDQDWVSDWVIQGVEMGYTQAQMSRAKKSRTEQNAIRAAYALAGL